MCGALLAPFATADTVFGQWTRVGTDTYLTNTGDEVGIGTTTPSAKLQVLNGSVLFNGTTGSTPISGAGTRMMYVPSRASFRVGLTSGSHWDNGNMGYASFATGENTLASGQHTFAANNGARATGGSSSAFGDSSLAADSGSFAIGGWTETHADYSVSMGFRARAYSYAAVVMGRFNTGLGSSSTAWVATDPVLEIGNGTGYGALSNALTVLKNGNTHIGGSNPAGYMLNVNGNSYFNGTGTWSGGSLWSDARFKTNVRSVTGAMSKVMNLHGVTFNYRDAEFPDRNFPGGTQLGFIAQDVEKVIPEVVVTNKDGYKAIAYQNLTALLTEAIKEQQGTIQQQHVKICHLENENAQLKERLHQIEAKLGIVPASASKIGSGNLK